MNKISCYLNKLFGLYQHKYNKQWDDLLNKLIDTGELIDVNSYTASISFNVDIYEVWIENKPYASHYLRRKNGDKTPDFLEFSPSIKTQLKFEEWLSQYESKKIKNEIAKIYGETND